MIAQGKNTEPPECGNCGRPKQAHSYNATWPDVTMRVVHLCVMCDLSPEQPVGRRNG